jgi:hypothetical protein
LNITPKLSELLSNFDLGLFLIQNKHLKAEKFILDSKDNTKELNTLLAQQLVIYPKADNKLPTFTKHNCWFTTRSFEQASSEETAFFKASLFSGGQLLDLSGGLGVDDWAFSNQFKSVISLDPDSYLNVLVRENFMKLGVKNIIRIDSIAENYLETTEGAYDLIYLDADRRTEKGKAFFLDQGKPNYLAIKNLCAKVSSKVLLKLSPMIDLTYLKNTLPNLTKIWVLGDKSEVKEILAYIDFSQPSELETEVVVLNNSGKSIHFKNTNNQPVTPKLTNLNYFFEPHSCLIKSNLYKEYATMYSLQLLSAQSLYFTGKHLPNIFLGRAFEIIQIIDFSKAKVKDYLERCVIKNANVSKKNFPIEVDEIKKIFKLKDGGEEYLFFSTNEKGLKVMFHCKKIH